MSVVAAKGGIYREGIAGAPRYLNPLLAQFNQADQDLTPLLFRGLVRVDEGGRYHPDLARQWWVDPSGMTYTVALRQDVYWHDGAPLVADDVLYTVHTMQSPDFPGLKSLHDFWGNVQVKKLDDHAVQFSLAEPLAPFLDALTIGILPDHLWHNIPASLLTKSELNLHPVGTGPFRFQGLYRNRLVLVPGNFLGGEQPYLDAVHFYFYPDAYALLAAYQRGEVDGVADIPLSLLPEIKHFDDMQLFFGIRSSYISVLLNQQNDDVPYLRDRRVRRALLMAINRQGLVDDLLNGAGVVAETPFLPYNWAYTNDIRHYAYDPKEAAQILTQAGWQEMDDGVRAKDGRRLSILLYTDDLPLHVAVGQALVAAWNDIGVDAHMKQVSFASLLGEHLSTHRFQAALVRWDLSGDPDPYPLWHSTQIDGGQNYGGWRNRYADEELEIGRRTTDFQKRVQAYHHFQDIFAQEVPALLLYYPVYTYGVRNTVRGVRVGTMTRPADRFHFFSQWYVAEKRVPVFPSNR